MRTLTPSSLLILAFAASLSTQVMAERTIAKCVNAQGELTFTDFLCETTEAGHNPLLMTESATTPSVRSRIPSVIKADKIAENKLRSATSDAQTQCNEKFSRYFKRRHPEANSVPSVEFSNVVDQFINGPNISISLSAPVEYADSSYSTYSSVECTVQRFKADSNWVVGFREN